MEENISTDYLKRVKLCGVQGCCPTVDIYGDKVVITDDEGGKVTLTKAQWRDNMRPNYWTISFPLRKNVGSFSF